MSKQKYDLRKVIEELKQIPGQYHETDKAIDPEAELSGVYRYIGAGGTVKRPTQEGPAMMFNNVKGFEKSRVLIGMLASRKRVGMILHHDYKTLGNMLNEAVMNFKPKYHLWILNTGCSSPTIQIPMTQLLSQLLITYTRYVTIHCP